VRANPPPAGPPPTPVVETPNPAYSRHLVITNTESAHAAGFTGAGIRIGVVDSGVNRNHPALSPRVVSNLVYIGSAGNNLSVDDVVGHGTAVSQIMAGTPFGAWPGGIAPGAQIVSARIISDKPPTDDGSGQGNEVHGALGLKSIHQDLINRGVRIMNNSWGGLYWTDLNATAPIADEYRPFIFSNNGLVVFATGNEGAANPSNTAALPSKPGPNGTMPAADLERGWLAVTAVDPDNIQQLDRGSDGTVYPNACGVAMRYCLAAPGTVTVTGTNDTTTNPTYWRWKGTSFAAPIVSGAAALVWQAFPYFSNDAVRQTILGTATDLGSAGIDPVFGNGLLNTGLAVKGPQRLDFGDFAVDFNDTTSTFDNRLSGTGSLTKGGTGTLVLAGGAFYTGATRVNGGSVRVGYMAGDAAIAPAGTLVLGNGAGGNIENAGRFDVTQNSVQVDGRYQQASTGTLAINVGNPLRVNGIDIDGGALQVMGIRSGYTWMARDPAIVTFGGGVNGHFDALTSGPGVFLQGSLEYDSQIVWLDITRLDVTVAAQAMGLSAMAVDSAERIEGAFGEIDRSAAGPQGGTPTSIGGGFLAAAGELQRLPDSASAERSLSSLSGELHAADTAFAKLAIDGNRHALQSHLDELANAPLTGAWAANLDEQRGVAHFDLRSNGWLIGQDLRLRDNLFVGAAFGETDSLVQSSLRNDRERNRQLEGQLYAQWNAGGNYLLGRVALGHMDRTMQRELFLGVEGFDVSSHYSSRYEAMNVEAGRRFDLGGVLTPYVGLQAMQLDRGAFSEGGAFGFGLDSNASQWRETQGLAGLRMEYGWDVRRARVSLQSHVEWQHALSQSGYDIDARFNGIDVWSPINGSGFRGDATTLGVGIESRWRGDNLLGLSLDTRREAGGNFGEATLRWIRPF